MVGLKWIDTQSMIGVKEYRWISHKLKFISVPRLLELISLNWL